MWIRFKDSEHGTILTNMDNYDYVYAFNSGGKYNIAIEKESSSERIVLFEEISLETAQAAIKAIADAISQDVQLFDLTAWLEEYEEAEE